MAQVVYMTESGLEKLKAELEHLRGVERPAISAQIAEEGRSVGECGIRRCQGGAGPVGDAHRQDGRDAGQCPGDRRVAPKYQHRSDLVTGDVKKPENRHERHLYACF